MRTRIATALRNIATASSAKGFVDQIGVIPTAMKLRGLCWTLLVKSCQQRGVVKKELITLELDV